MECLTLSLSLMSISLDALSPLSLCLPLKFYIYLFLPVTTLFLSPSCLHLGHPQCGSLLAKFKLSVFVKRSVASLSHSFVSVSLLLDCVGSFFFSVGVCVPYQL